MPTETYFSLTQSQQLEHIHTEIRLLRASIEQLTAQIEALTQATTMDKNDYLKMQLCERQNRLFEKKAQCVSLNDKADEPTL